MGLCSCAALPPMVCAERSASREVQLMPLCYYYVCFTLIPLAQGDYLTAKVGDRSEPTSAGRLPP